MLGIIVTGHGTFASGLTANMELIIGSQTAYCGVDFVDGDSVDDLAQKLKQATSRLASCDGMGHPSIFASSWRWRIPAFVWYMA